jgi:hypothetical protein
LKGSDAALEAAGCGKIFAEKVSADPMINLQDLTHLTKVFCLPDAFRAGAPHLGSGSSGAQEVTTARTKHPPVAHRTDYRATAQDWRHRRHTCRTNQEVVKSVRRRGLRKVGQGEQIAIGLTLPSRHAWVSGHRRAS